MGLVVNRELAKTERGMTVLATIGSASVFVGLFGTVWGIMNSFRAIAISQKYKFGRCCSWYCRGFYLRRRLALSLLFPASVFYNKFTSDFDSYAGAP